MMKVANNKNMKTIKNIVLTVLLISFVSSKAQNLNELSSDQFYNEICFANVCLNQIIGTHSNSGNLNGLFSGQLSSNHNVVDSANEAIDYEVNGYYFRFEDLGTNSKDSDYDIAYIDVEGDAKISLDSITFGLGDNISKLGNVKILKPGEITFINFETNASLDIKYENNIIKEIGLVFY